MKHDRHLTSAATDPRWKALNLVQTARERLGLKARSLTVLRGLLTFLKPNEWGSTRMCVFPSNSALQERCDGIDERTLRRHLSQLCAAGLIERHMSPNRKRYQVRDETGAVVLSYGFDLTALHHHAERLENLAQEVLLENHRIQSLKAILRDLLWKSQSSDAATMRLLRNKTSVEVLEQAIADLRISLGLTDSHGQTDRHIQNSNKDYIEEASAPLPQTNLTLQRCVEAAKDAVSFAAEPIRSWHDLHELAATLAPSLGLTRENEASAFAALGHRGFTLAILGLVQSIGRIKSIPSYLSALSAKAKAGRLDLSKMYASLTRKTQFPAGNCTPHRQEIEFYA